MSKPTNLLPSPRHFRIRAALLAGLLACLPLAANAETVTLDNGISIDFPAAPAPLVAPATGFELIQPADETSSTHVYRIEKVQLPAWASWLMRKAPDAAAEMLEERMSDGILKSLPGAEVTDESPITVNGFPGTEIQIGNITSNPDNPLKKDIDQYRGRFLLIDGDFYLYGMGDNAANPASEEEVYAFLDSLQIAHQRTPGNPEQQLQMLGLWMVGALLLALLLFVAFVIAVVVLIKRLRKRGKKTT